VSKSIVTIVLLLFVGVSIVYLVVGQAAPTPADAPAPATAPAGAASQPAPAEASVPTDAIIAYYFHGDVRCASCNQIEALSQQALEQGYGKDLADGKLLWRVVNVDKPANKHFIADYKLATRSVVLVERRQGEQTRWKNLTRVWELLRDDGAFVTYVQDELAAFRQGG
jgi:hypothetical protein